MLSCLFFSLIIRIINGKVLRNININGETWMNVYWMNEWKLYLSSEKSKSAYIKKWKKCKPYIKTDQIRANFFLFFLSPNLLFFSYFSKKFSANFRSDRSTYVRNIFFHSFYIFEVMTHFAAEESFVNKYLTTLFEYNSWDQNIVALFSAERF